MSSSEADAAAAAEAKKTASEAVRKALQRGLEGGLSGAAAMGINVLTLMWMRTTINYQYRYGTSTMEAFRTLYKDGGVLRFYRGLLPALIQGPMSRFGDTAANTGTLALLDTFDATKDMAVGVKTVAASTSAALFRIVLMPVDTFKTKMQVEGKDAISKLMSKARTSGPSVFWHGSLAAAAATFVGHYPWFFTYNLLNEKLPKYDTMMMKLSRSALIGFCASAISDTCSNSIRVIKVYKQAHTTSISYPEALRRVIAEDGVMGLMGRGLQTKIVSNGVQGLMFSVLWKYIDDAVFKNKNKK